MKTSVFENDIWDIIFCDYSKNYTLWKNTNGRWVGWRVFKTLEECKNFISEWVD